MVGKRRGYYNCLSCNPVVLISNGHQDCLNISARQIAGPSSRGSDLLGSGWGLPGGGRKGCRTVKCLRPRTATSHSNLWNKVFNTWSCAGFLLGNHGYRGLCLSGPFRKAQGEKPQARGGISKKAWNSLLQLPGGRSGPGLEGEPAK